MFRNKNPLRRRQYLGTLIGIGIGVVIYALLPLKASEQMLSLGPMNTGHEDLSCETCHTPANGTMMQQLTTNIQWAFGMRSTSADFGTENVDNKKCQACHDRPNDRHPVHRFLEPRFRDAVNKIDVTQCETCHREHNGVRLVLEEATFCVNCHSDLEIKDDPLDVSHETLIAQKAWNTCLQCHDFHGNHMFDAAERMKDTIPMTAIINYIKGGEDPYTDKKKYYPLSEQEWAKK